MVQELNFQNLVNALPPQSIEAEESILGGILLDPEAIARITEIIVPEAFYIQNYQIIYQAALSLHSQGKPTDLITITTWLKDHKLLDKIGGTNQLVSLVEQTVSTVNIDLLAQLVMEKYIRRRLIAAGNNIVQLGFDTTTELSILLDKAEQQIFKLSQERPQTGLVPISQTLIETFTELETRNDEEILLPGLVSDFYDLDAVTAGFQRSDLIILAGRPSMGKTSLGLNIARNIALRYHLPVAIFSLEMSCEQLVQRMLSMESGIPSNRLRGGRISQLDWDAITNALGTLSGLPIYIDDSPNLMVMQMRSNARRLQTEKGSQLGLILLDYLQLMEGSGGDNRVQELSKITRSLKGLARELNVPIIALSQLSRGVESRNNKRPMMSDLRESGCLTGDSLVTLADSGVQVPIRELIGKPPFAVWSLNQNTMKLEKAIVSHAFSTGTKPVFKLTTRLGRTIRATPNHKFLTINGWLRLDDLKIGSPIETLANSDIYWDQIIAIEADGISEVYDLTVPTFHNFIANNIVVHNSIEQDADLVIMLYRDEYYNPDTPDRSIAEVIITKHRNGPTGTIKLIFDSELTLFKNLARPKN